MKNTIISVLSAATLLFGSCSDWTEEEKIDFRKPTDAELNTPEYRSYLEALRAYKQGEHKIAMITISGTSEEPRIQNQHLTAMPDSVDFICMRNAGGLHPVLVAEMAEIRARKGTQTLCVVDYASVESEWKSMEDAKDEAGEPAGTTDQFAAFCRDRIDSQLACCDEYGFDGIEMSYIGNTQSEIGKLGQQILLERVSAWRGVHMDKLFFVRGYIQNFDYGDEAVVSLLADCDYIVILCGSSSSYSQMTMEIRRKTLGEMKDKVPADRFILEVAIPSIADPTQIGATAPVAAAWVNNIDASKPDVIQKTEEFTKAGLAVDNAQDDYFNKVRIYDNVRQAIAVMAAPAPEPEPEPTPES